jgi:hypothetical protein
MRSAKVFGLMLVLGTAAASSAFSAGASTANARPALPPGAVQVADGVYSLGTRTVHGKQLQGFAFVDRARAGGNAKKGGSSCFAYLARDTRWLGAEPWSVDDSNAPISGMATLLAKDVGTWEGAAGADILGNGSVDRSYDANTSTVDDRNGAEFAPIADAGVIAVTYTWGVFGGPPQGRQLVEWDMVFDSDSFAWSTTGATNAMDFENIATHELGHAMGLGHPSNTCTEETMYAFASLGETKKRDLNAGDVQGIDGLY